MYNARQLKEISDKKQRDASISEDMLHHIQIITEGAVQRAEKGNTSHTCSLAVASEEYLEQLLSVLRDLGYRVECWGTKTKSVRQIHICWSKA